jgi:hypothetical protein
MALGLLEFRADQADVHRQVPALAEPFAFQAACRELGMPVLLEDSTAGLPGEQGQRSVSAFQLVATLRQDD